MEGASSDWFRREIDEIFTEYDRDEKEKQEQRQYEEEAQRARERATWEVLFEQNEEYRMFFGAYVRDGVLLDESIQLLKEIEASNPDAAVRQVLAVQEIIREISLLRDYDTPEGMNEKRGLQVRILTDERIHAQDGDRLHLSIDLFSVSNVLVPGTGIDLDDLDDVMAAIADEEDSYAQIAEEINTLQQEIDLYLDPLNHYQQIPTYQALRAELMVLLPDLLETSTLLSADHFRDQLTRIGISEAAFEEAMNYILAPVRRSKPSRD